MTAQLPSKERLEELAAGKSGFNLRMASHDESMQMASALLAGMDQKPVYLVGPIEDEPGRNRRLWLEVPATNWMAKAFYAVQVVSEQPVPVAIENAIEYIESIAFHIDENDYHGQHIAHYMQQALAWLKGTPAGLTKPVTLTNEDTKQAGNASVMPDYEGTAMTQRECYRAGLEAGKAARISGDWIKCSDRMPEEYGDTVLVWCKSCVQRGYYTGGRVWIIEGRWFSDKSISHWMPMLAAPQPEEKQ